MVNEDVLIKFARKRGYKYTWPDQVNYMLKRLGEVKLGFPGIGNDDLTMVEFKDIHVGDLFIYDTYIENQGNNDEAPIMFNVLGNSKCQIEGIGFGYDSVRDPDRINFRWKDIIDIPKLNDNQLVLRVDSRPDLNGGPAYYYFFKAYRDNRF